MSPGPRLRTDLVDAYLFTTHANAVRLLQLHRTEEPLRATWQPVMGHVHAGETAVQALVREVAEETGLDIARDDVRVWSLEQVHPFYLPERDEIYLSPRFAIRAPDGWSPTINEEHDEFRWIDIDDARDAFTWPGQHAAIDEIRAHLAPENDTGRLLRLDVTD